MHDLGKRKIGGESTDHGKRKKKKDGVVRSRMISEEDDGDVKLLRVSVRGRKQSVQGSVMAQIMQFNVL